jgi:hypothetical protein
VKKEDAYSPHSRPKARSRRGAHAIRQSGNRFTNLKSEEAAGVSSMLTVHHIAQ